jgi:hypothetical protein
MNFYIESASSQKAACIINQFIYFYYARIAFIHTYDFKITRKSRIRNISFVSRQIYDYILVI